MNAPTKHTTAANVSSILAGRQSPARSEATQIEQSRAVAEVQAMVTVAQTRRRDVSRSMEAMRQSCGMMGLAERAFFKFPRAGQTVAGPSIHLAVELARCWGNINYGIRELSRDDYAGQSEMLAYAWDMETNARADTTFIVPHMRDKRGGPEALTDMRDIYENNANNGARRLREMIFRVLPPWFRETAKDLCHETLQKGEGEQPLPVRIANMAKAFADIGIGRDRIEAKIGMSIDAMTAVDLANLIVSFKSIRAGEVAKDEEFPPLVASQVAGILNPGPQPVTGDAPAALVIPAKSMSQAAAEPEKEAAPSWFPEVVGQDAITAAIVALITDKAASIADLDAIDKANAERVAKFTQANRAKITVAMEDRREDLGGK